MEIRLQPIPSAISHPKDTIRTAPLGPPNCVSALWLAHSHSSQSAKTGRSQHESVDRISHSLRTPTHRITFRSIPPSLYTNLKPLPTQLHSKASPTIIPNHPNTIQDQPNTADAFGIVSHHMPNQARSTLSTKKVRLNTPEEVSTQISNPRGHQRFNTVASATIVRYYLF